MTTESDQSRAHRLRYEELDALVQRMDHLERVYSNLPLQWRTPLVKRFWLSRCVRELADSFAKARHRTEGSFLHIPRFEHELADLIAPDLSVVYESQDDHDGPTRLLEEIAAAKKAARRPRDDRYRSVAEAEATAIVYSAVEDCPAPAGKRNGWRR